MKKNLQNVVNFISSIILIALTLCLIGCPCPDENPGNTTLPRVYNVEVDNETVHIGDGLTVTFYHEKSSIAKDSYYYDAKVIDNKLVSKDGEHDLSDIIFFNVDIGDAKLQKEIVHGNQITYYCPASSYDNKKTTLSENVLSYNYDHQLCKIVVTVIVPENAKSGYMKLSDSFYVMGTGFYPNKLTVLDASGDIIK